MEAMHWVCFHYVFEHGDVDVDLASGGGGTLRRPLPRVLQLLKCATQGGRALESWVRDAASETAYTRFSTTTWWCSWGRRHGSHKTRRQ
jgi:hypothetical protein